MPKRLVVPHSHAPALWEAAKARLGRRYGNLDPRWLGVPAVYGWYLLESQGRLRYRDFLKDGKMDPAYGVIQRRLPNEGRVAILGDWGTGMPDAAALLEEVMSKHSPVAIIHLGDVYYAGTPHEYRHNFLKPLEAAWAKHGRVPVFMIPGNHDYYCWGLGFYRALKRLNEPGWQQDASYFCVRTEDRRQLVGLDTGQSDVDPLTKIHFGGSRPQTPQIRPSEKMWLASKLTAPTILLSHHQVMSAHVAVGHDPAWPPYFNHELLSIMIDPYGMRRKEAEHVVAWLWGHEHNLALYEDGLFGLAKGRLVGASAYEETHGEDPYKVNFPEVRYKLDADGKFPQVGQVANFYNHSYCIVDLGSWSISYYQIPSFAGETVSLPEGQPWCLATEAL